jgi:hypothetical protein
MLGSDSHSLNSEILLFHIEIFISNLFLRHVIIFLIYRLRIIENCWRI